jgi:hypothetical protein
MLKITHSIVLFSFLFSLSTFASNGSKLPKKEALKIARKAYIYGLPAVFSDFTRQVALRPNNS